ncbi:MAG TPA: c-type cytochrome [Verrucomicrobiota bacterium]|nr:hypothetical protein [Verrucomicrobiales bacterium]HRI13241.1 c-type cytochrome [Verrucomicrobiota bacterium]
MENGYLGIEKLKKFAAGCLAALAVLVAGVPRDSRAEVDDRTRLALEALNRLKDTDLEVNPALKQAVLRVLEQVRGEPEFVEVVRDFKLTGHERELIDLAVRKPQAPQAVTAVRLLLASTNSAILKEALAGKSAPTVVELLGAATDPRAVAWLQPLLTDSNRPLELRQTAVRGLPQTTEGAHVLLALATDGVLPKELRPVAATELRAARGPEVRAAAIKLFPIESAAGGNLPPVSELLTMSGDPKQGAEIFRRPAVACHTCHQVNGDGTDFGPKLSEIGSKLGKEALIASVLDPSSGISFGFEAWRIELKNGTELFGLVVSETAETLSVKQQGGQVTDVKKSEVATREKQSLSIMPAGLEQSLTPQEFVDLIAYLSSLRKAGM